MKQLKLFLKRQLINALRYFSIYVQKAFLPMGVKGLQNLTEDYQPLYQHQVISVKRKPPISLRKPHKKFTQRLTTPAFNVFVLKAHNWRIWGNQGAVITANNFLLAEASREFSNQFHSIFHQFKLIKPKLNTSLTSVLAASGANVYYHWMFDIMPRVDLLKRSRAFNSIEHFVINCEFNHFQKETLKRVGIKSDKIISSLDHWNFHLEASDLIVPSLVSPNDYPSLESCQYLRQLFFDEIREPEYYVDIYLQRTSGRVVENERELIEFLKGKDFQIIRPELLSVATQARIFAGARTIIGAHGSAFTNIVFCQPATIVIELFAPDWINPCYWMIAEHIGLKYGYLMSSKSHLNIKTKQKNTDIKVDINQLSTLLTILNSHR